MKKVPKQMYLLHKTKKYAGKMAFNNMWTQT